jgi:hypothetical protein
MDANAAKTITSETENPFATLLDGYRFKVCETPGELAEALAVRDRVYRETGYEVACPDQYDHRSWILRAEDATTGECVGTMRLTPRFAGPFEAEEYFELPAALCAPRSIEITRFAILPEHRRGNTPVPAVAFGLFRLCYEIFQVVGGRTGVVCSKASRAFTYTMMGFEGTGLKASYEKLNGYEHEVLATDFSDAPQFLIDNPFRTLFLDAEFPQVEVPSKRPAMGLVADPTAHEMPLSA